MFSWVSTIMYQVLAVVLFTTIVGMGIKMWSMHNENTRLESDNKTVVEKLATAQTQLALSKANEQILTVGINTQNDAIASMKIDLVKAAAQYKVKEKIINRTIFSEREVVRDLNDSEDWNNTKRIVNEIINLW